MPCFIGSIAIVLAFGRWKQSLTFIKTNRLSVHSCLLCKLTDAHGLSLGKKASISRLDPIATTWFLIGRIKSYRRGES